jgi:hypothetical protein
MQENLCDVVLNSDVIGTSWGTDYTMGFTAPWSNTYI